MKAIIFIFCLVMSQILWAQSYYENVRIFSSSDDQTEVSAAINPHDNSHLFLGANTYNQENKKSNQGYYYSFNSGRTWSGNDELPYLSSGAADPSVCFDLNGNVFFTYLKKGDIWKIKLQRSSDGGKNWEQPIVVGNVGDYIGPDKPYMTIDQNQNSEFKNTVYISFIENTRYLKTVLFYSYNARNNTFTTKRFVAKNDTEIGYQSPNIAIGPDGNIYLIYIYGFNQAKKILFEKSSPGGGDFDTLSNDLIITNVNQIGKYINGYYRLKANDIRVNSFPSMAVDCSDGPYRGNIYVVWADDRYGTPDILLMKSTDEGQTWIGPIIVNNVMENDQWHPWIDVGPDGSVNVIFYDSRNDYNNELTDIYMARSTDGGDHFINFKINNIPLNLSVLNTNNGYWGDYISVIATQNKIYGFWMDNRTLDDEGKPIYQIYMALINPFKIIIDQHSKDFQERINQNMCIWKNRNFIEFTPPDTFFLL